MKTYNQEKEEFYSHLTGSSLFRALVVFLHIPTISLLLKLVQGFDRPIIWRDYFVFVLPLLFSITLLSEYGSVTLLALCLVNSGLLAFSWYFKLEPTLGKEQSTNSHESSVISEFKGMIMLVTCLAILCVDFKIFPREFAKTEGFGVSIMDIGVGAFVFSSALTSKFARGDLFRHISLASHSIILRVPWKNVVVLGLGIGRMIAIKVLDYHEQSTEYGHHWNFFVTLFAVWTLVDMIHRVIPRQYIFIVSVVSLLAYQIALSETQLTYFILYAPRNTFITANREGIFSLFSFVPLYLIVESISNKLFFSDKVASSKEEDGDDDDASSGDSMYIDPTISGSTNSMPILQSKQTQLYVISNVIYSKKAKLLFYHLFGYSGWSWMLWWVCNIYQPTSRRLSNATYSLLVLAFSFTIMLAIVTGDILIAKQIKIATLEYVNKHQLAVFLGANVITGLVNMSMQTIHSSNSIAMGVLISYSFIVMAMAWALEFVSNVVHA